MLQLKSRVFSGWESQTRSHERTFVVQRVGPYSLWLTEFPQTSVIYLRDRCPVLKVYKWVSREKRVSWSVDLLTWNNSKEESERVNGTSEWERRTLTEGLYRRFRNKIWDVIHLRFLMSVSTTRNKLLIINSYYTNFFFSNSVKYFITI